MEATDNQQVIEANKYWYKKTSGERYTNKKSSFNMSRHIRRLENEGHYHKEISPVTHVPKEMVANTDSDDNASES